MSTTALILSTSFLSHLHISGSKLARLVLSLCWCFIASLYFRRTGVLRLQALPVLPSPLKGLYFLGSNVLPSVLRMFKQIHQLVVRYIPPVTGSLPIPAFRWHGLLNVQGCTIQTKRKQPTRQVLLSVLFPVSSSSPFPFEEVL